MQRYCIANCEEFILMQIVKAAWALGKGVGGGMETAKSSQYYSSLLEGIFIKRMTVLYRYQCFDRNKYSVDDEDLREVSVTYLGLYSKSVATKEGLISFNDLMQWCVVHGSQTRGIGNVFLQLTSHQCGAKHHPLYRLNERIQGMETAANLRPNILYIQRNSYRHS